MEVKRTLPIKRACQLKTHIISHSNVRNPSGSMSNSSYFCLNRNDHVGASNGGYQLPRDNRHCDSGECSVDHHCHCARHHCRHRFEFIKSLRTQSRECTEMRYLPKNEETSANKNAFFACTPTGEPGLGENYPSQTEMAIIYQSAAWILAGLLLAIIIFLIVALLINKKKKWVQMSCYSAPKKVRNQLLISGASSQNSPWSSSLCYNQC